MRAWAGLGEGGNQDGEDRPGFPTGMALNPTGDMGEEGVKELMGPAVTTILQGMAPQRAVGLLLAGTDGAWDGQTDPGMH